MINENIFNVKRIYLCGRYTDLLHYEICELRIVEDKEHKERDDRGET